MRTLLFAMPVMLPIANTRRMHFAGERPREQNLFLGSDECCQMGCQPTWQPAAAAGGQQVSSGGLQVYIADMSIWGEIPTFALKPQRGNWPLTLWCERRKVIIQSSRQKMSGRQHASTPEKLLKIFRSHHQNYQPRQSCQSWKNHQSFQP